MTLNHNSLASLEEFMQTSFDYIVIGGGNAGLVVASRLSENPDITVGILEAGKLRLDDENVSSIGGNQKMLHNPDYDWTFKTIPQVHHIARGKMVGGSSGINFMAYVRPSAEDIDSWGTQAPGWSWDALEPYFHKSEMLLPDTAAAPRPDYFARDEAFHGKSGPVAVSWSPSPAEIDPTVVKALGEVSVPCEHKDPYGGHRLGFAYHLATIDRRDKKIARSYAADYLKSCLDRQNLRILTEANALQILLDEKEKPIRARGIKFMYGGREHEITVTREVILSASSIHSPKLLELSGIGNPSILQAAGIPCLVDLPDVGENLQEHPLGAVTYELTKSPQHVTLDSVLTDQETFQAHLTRLLESQDGLLAGSIGLTGFIPYSSQVSQERLESTLATIKASQAHLTSAHYLEQSERVLRLLRDPQAGVIEVVGMPCNFDIATGYANQSRLISGPPPGSNDCYTILASPLYPMSRGSTHISTVDARLEPPQIDLAFLAHPADVDVLAAGITTADRAFRSKHLEGKTARRVSPPADVDLEDVDQAREFVRENVMVFNHSLGTCAMGRVVDEQLRVKGVAGLRIVDCSVIPNQIGANPMATVYALAERAADLIIRDM
ncbi:glucose-methanol-choline oxidoreductase, c-terminal [Trichoderma arundinaceum]|uniref:Glucose-methanol-choline oxidoreductase, c-terminal n=1 Tax=Trichoderma arundinaceum TaxID=490622 RepID=A0A395NKI6_TRIAR|nr:glucose-methanol-choline oxidoreductase, c-terminal [Trichoderma arundinaceum]